MFAIKYACVHVSSRCSRQLLNKTVLDSVWSSSRCCTNMQDPNSDSQVTFIRFWKGAINTFIKQMVLIQAVFLTASVLKPCLCRINLLFITRTSRPVAASCLCQTGQASENKIKRKCLKGAIMSPWVCCFWEFSLIFLLVNMKSWDNPNECVQVEVGWDFHFAYVRWYAALRYTCQNEQLRFPRVIYKRHKMRPRCRSLLHRHAWLPDTWSSPTSTSTMLMTGAQFWSRAVWVHLHVWRNVKTKL